MGRMFGSGLKSVRSIHKGNITKLTEEALSATGVKDYPERYIVSVLLMNVVNGGKIAGRIIERGSGEGVIGANVIVVETQQGASVDIDGNYVILNVVPET